MQGGRTKIFNHLKTHCREVCMAQFERDEIDNFLGIVRKYMQVRGNLSQKDLAEMCDIGVSTISRFLNQKTKEIDPHMIARIVAYLDIPIHEVIDFVAEEYTESFTRLVKFYKTEGPASSPSEEDMADPSGSESSESKDDLDDALSSLGTSKKKARANIKIGGKSRSIPFNTDHNAKNSEKSIREKLESLTPRQKAYLTDFLNLDVESKDLMVDLGNSLFRYFKQKGMEF